MLFTKIARQRYAGVAGGVQWRRLITPVDGTGFRMVLRSNVRQPLEDSLDLQEHPDLFLGMRVASAVLLSLAWISGVGGVLIGVLLVFGSFLLPRGPIGQFFGSATFLTGVLFVLGGLLNAVWCWCLSDVLKWAISVHKRVRQSTTLLAMQLREQQDARS